MSKFATYSKHYRDDASRWPSVATIAEGHIYLDYQDGVCAIGLEGPASMSQDELDRYGEAMAEALNKEIEDEFLC